MKNISPRTFLILLFIFFSFGGSAIFANLGNSLSSAFCQNNPNPVPEYGWKISSMDVAAQITESGDLKIREKITANFDVAKHGIYRTIPLLFEPQGSGYKSANFSAIKIESVGVLQDGSPAKFSNSVRGGSSCPGNWLAGEYNKEQFIKIGDPDQTITGQHEYIISYIVKNALRDDKGFPELYWNIIGQGWGVDIDRASIRVTKSGSLEFSTNKIYCYSGAYGSTEEKSCQTFIVDEGTIDFTIDSLRPYHGVTIQTAIKPQYSAQLSANLTGKKDRTQEYIFGKWYYLLAFLPFLYFVYIWNKNGRDPASRGIIAPRFDAPDSMSPAQAGMVADQSVDNVDIAAIIISIAQKGWMKIVYKSGAIFGIGEDYIFEKQNNPSATPLSEEEMLIFSSIFSSTITNNLSDLLSKVINSKTNNITKSWGSKSASFKMNFNIGDSKVTGIENIPGVADIVKNSINNTDIKTDKETVSLSSLKNIFYPIVDETRSKLYSWSVEQGYLKTTPGPIQSFFVPGYLLIFVFWYLAISNSSILWICFTLLSTILSFIVLFFYRFYTAKGKVAQEEILGLKMYMSTAEKDRIEFHNAPEKSPELFLKLLPYAMALGVVKIWADKFESLNMQPPSWYVGPYTHFNSVTFADSLTKASSSFSSTMTSVPSRSSGGGSGGGFSGGGGGGGGGGSW